MLLKNSLLALLLFSITSCGNNNSNAAADSATTVDKENIGQLEMFKTSDCGTCHKRTETLVGPSFVAIAERYLNAADTTITSLAHTVIKGSTGKWQTSVAPMPPHPALQEADAIAMVKYILNEKK